MLVTVPTAVAGAVLGFYLLLLGYPRLMQVSWVSDRTRQFSKTANRRFSNRIAGTRLGILYFNLAALRHVGRRSGWPYVTPLAAYRLGDGFMLAP